MYEATYRALFDKRDLRRSGVEEDGEDMWSKHIYTDVFYIQKNYWMISKNTWDRLQVTDDCLQRTKQTYMLDVEKMTIHEAMVDRVYQDCLRNIFEKREPILILNREQVIEGIKFRFDHEFAAQKHMREFCENFGNDHWMMDMFCKVKKMMLWDKFALKFNVEYEDFDANCENFNIWESDEV